MVDDHKQVSPAKPTSWRAQAVQLAAIVAVVFVAKGAIAEPFYVPSGSMEPTLVIGDALVASKFPYGYGAASLPIQITLPETGRLFGETPKRGDVVVFRWPGDRSQAWVKRVVGLPGDRIQLRQGLLLHQRPCRGPEAGRHRPGRRRSRQHRTGLSVRRDAAEWRQPRHLQDARQWPARQHAGSDGAAGPAVRAR